MEDAKKYIEDVLETVKERDPHEEEFYQAVKEIFDSLAPYLAEHPKYQQFAF